MNRERLLRGLGMIAAGAALMIVGSILAGAPAEPADPGAVHYVVPSGSGAREGRGDGRSWETAWRGLDGVDWTRVRPGDTVILDGGAERAVYESTLAPAASGGPGRPITVRRADSPGHSGQVVIDGGRGVALPWSGQRDYVSRADGVRRSGVRLERVSHLVIDGGAWRGILIRGHNGPGVDLAGSASDVTIRNVEIADNGVAVRRKDGSWTSDLPGIRLAGRNIAVERAIIHDCGQDCIQSGGVSNFALRRSWLYNSRPHPTDPAEPFNWPTHSDGLQIYGGHRQDGVLVEDCIVGPGFNQGLILGDGNSYPGEPWAVVDDVTVRNSTFVGHFGKSSNASIISHPKLPADVPPRRWRIERCTLWRDPRLAQWLNLYIRGVEHAVSDCIVYGGGVRFPDSEPRCSGNVEHDAPGLKIGEDADPLFPATGFTGVGRGFDAFDLAPRAGAARGKGSTMTSREKFFAGEDDPWGN